RINKDGANTIYIYYQGEEVAVTVRGKAVQLLVAVYSGKTLDIGKEVSRGDLKVTAYYTDGSQAVVTDYTFPDPLVQYAGTNYFKVYYGGMEATFSVEGKETLAVSYIIATYTGDSVIVTNDVPKSDVTVTAIYNDGSYKKVKDFTLSPATVTQVGTNKITVAYGGATATIEVWGAYKFIDSIEVKYEGDDVVVGRSVNPDDVNVTATFNDGTKGRVTNFTMSGSLITQEGENVIAIYCDSRTASIVVMGIVDFTYSFDNINEKYIFGTGNYYSIVTLAMEAERKTTDFNLTEVPAKEVEYIVNRVFHTEDYVAYELSYDDDNMMVDFPMAMRITKPLGFDAEKFGVYFTTNRKTIIGKMNMTEVTEEVGSQYEGYRVFEFLVYRPGTYIVLKEIKTKFVTEIDVEKKVKMKVGRSYSVDPVVIPYDADVQDLEFKSDNENIVTVTPNGKMKAVGEGVTNVTVSATDGSGVYAEIEVTVKPR
ncbi:MAG: Ig-like domain-containing protein, partial [Lachnospiraceae bacterium]|nr:Ig-like domain-containing protein [Lachnospiraceae bacterium]